MEATRALSPELTGLFGKIQSQAEEYGKAFDLLEKCRKEFEASISKLNALEENVRNDSELAISKINTNVLESLIILKNKTDETVKLSIDLGDIKAFKTSLENLKSDLTNLNNTLTKQSEEIDSTLKYFKKKSEMELESTLLGLKSKIDKDIQSEGQKIEIRTNLRLKQMESIFLTFDDRLKLIEGNVSSAVKRLSLDMDLLKHGYNFDAEGNDLSSPMIDEVSLNNRFSAIEMMMNSLSERIDENVAPYVPPPKNISDERIEEFEKKLAATNGRISELLSKQQQSQSSGGSSMAVAVIGLILAIIAIVMSFI